MAVITLPPVIIDSVDFSRPSGGYEQPPYEFQIGTDLYLVLRNHEVAPDHVSVYLSTNNGVTWIAQDDSNGPGNIEPFTCFLESGGNIDVCGTHSGAFVIIQFNTTTKLWGSPTAAASMGENQFFFYRKTGGDYVVIFRHAASISYIKYSSGAWDGSATVLVAIDRQIFGGALAAGDVAFVFAAPAAGGSAALYRIDASFGVTGPFALTDPWSNITRPSVKIFGSDSVAVAQLPSSGGSSVVVEIGTPLASPVMTRYPIYSTTGSQMVSYATLIVGSDGKLNVFWVLIDYTTSPLVDQIDQSVFDGVSAWSSPILFYDEIANPPADSVPDQLNQFIHAIDGIQLAGGDWVFQATMETLDGISGEHCTGFVLLSSTPPVTATCSITITAPIPCQKFKLYANSMVEFGAFGSDQLQTYKFKQVSEEMKLAVAKPKVGRWNLTAAGDTNAGEE